MALKSPAMPGDMNSTRGLKQRGCKHRQCVRCWQISLTHSSQASRAGKGVSETSGTGSRVLTGTTATDSAKDAMLREQGGGEHAPV